MAFVFQYYESFFTFRIYRYGGLKERYNGNMWEVINLIPLKNITYWILNTPLYHLRLVKYNYGAWSYLNNLIYPCLAFIPAGVLAKHIWHKSYTRTLICFIPALAGIMVMRMLLWIGYFDVDKILLATFGYTIGYLAVDIISKKRIDWRS